MQVQQTFLTTFLSLCISPLFSLGSLLPYNSHIPQYSQSYISPNSHMYSPYNTVPYWAYSHPQQEHFSNPYIDLQKIPLSDSSEEITAADEMQEIYLRLEDLPNNALEMTSDELIQMKLGTDEDSEEDNFSVEDEDSDFSKVLVKRKGSPFGTYFTSSSSSSSPLLRQDTRDRASEPLHEHYHHQDSDSGAYHFGYNTNEQWREEHRTPEGVVKGGYGWMDANGVWHVQKYVADHTGYHVVHDEQDNVGNNVHKPVSVIPPPPPPPPPFVLNPKPPKPQIISTPPKSPHHTLHHQPTINFDFSSLKQQKLPQLDAPPVSQGGDNDGENSKEIKVIETARPQILGRPPIAHDLPVISIMAPSLIGVSDGHGEAFLKPLQETDHSTGQAQNSNDNSNLNPFLTNTFTSHKIPSKITNFDLQNPSRFHFDPQSVKRMSSGFPDLVSSSLDFSGWPYYILPTPDSNLHGVMQLLQNPSSSFNIQVPLGQSSFNSNFGPYQEFPNHEINHYSNQLNTNPYQSLFTMHQPYPNQETMDNTPDILLSDIFGKYEENLKNKKKEDIKKEKDEVKIKLSENNENKYGNDQLNRQDGLLNLQPWSSSAIKAQVKNPNYVNKVQPFGLMRQNSANNELPKPAFLKGDNVSQIKTKDENKPDEEYLGSVKWKLPVLGPLQSINGYGAKYGDLEVSPEVLHKEATPWMIQTPPKKKEEPLKAPFGGYFQKNRKPIPPIKNKSTVQSPSLQKPKVQPLQQLMNALFGSLVNGNSANLFGGFLDTIE